MLAILYSNLNSCDSSNLRFNIYPSLNWNSRMDLGSNIVLNYLSFQLTPVGS